MKIPSLDQLGTPGVVGIGLLLFCLMFYEGSVAPAQAELADLKAQEEQLLAAAPSRTAEATAAADAAGRAAAEQSLLSVGAFPELLKELNALAEKRGVTIDRAFYALSEKEGEGGEGRRRLEISLPLRASYLSLRAFLRDIMQLKASPALDELKLSRQQATDPLIEVNVRLSYPFAASP